MKDKVKELLSLIKGNKPCYFIQYTVQDGEIIILDGHKSYPTDNNGKGRKEDRRSFNVSHSCSMAFTDSLIFHLLLL